MANEMTVSGCYPMSRKGNLECIHSPINPVIWLQIQAMVALGDRPVSLTIARYSSSAVHWSSSLYKYKNEKLDRNVARHCLLPAFCILIWKVSRSVHWGGRLVSSSFYSAGAGQPWAPSGKKQSSSVACSGLGLLSQERKWRISWTASLR